MNLIEHRLIERHQADVQMVLETKSALESGIVGSGHSFAATRLDAQRSVAGWINEQTGGLSYLHSIRQLVQRVDSDWDSVQADLEAIRCARQFTISNLSCIIEFFSSRVLRCFSSVPGGGRRCQHGQNDRTSFDQEPMSFGCEHTMPQV